MAIQQTLYRVGNASPIVKALIEARRSGKQVTAVVELKARFDEERNITWAEEMEKAGVNVVYGLVGMKIHAKLCLVVRREPEGVSRYVHIGTGNYNPSTAKMYTDMGLITANPNICADVTDLFNVMTGYAHREQYRELLVSPLSMRRSLLDDPARNPAPAKWKRRNH
ncbi:MAG: phospholipase D-like domain-containing protein [Bilophila wadsworthia]